MAPQRSWWRAAATRKWPKSLSRPLAAAPLSQLPFMLALATTITRETIGEPIFLPIKEKKDKSGRIIDFLQHLGFNSNSSFSSFSFSVFYFSFLAVTIYFPHIFMMWSLAVVFPGSLEDFLHRGIGSKAKPGIDSDFEKPNALLNPESDRQCENN